MSGGSWEYVYLKFYAVADALKDDRCTEYSDRLLFLTEEQKEARHRLADHVRSLGEVMRTVEWVDSGDMLPGDDVEAINTLIGKPEKRELK